MRDKAGCWWLADPQYALPSDILPNGCTLGSVCQQPRPTLCAGVLLSVRAGWSARPALLIKL